MRFPDNTNTVLTITVRSEAVTVYEEKVILKSKHKVTKDSGGNNYYDWPDEVAYWSRSDNGGDSFTYMSRKPTGEREYIATMEIPRIPNLQEQGVITYTGPGRSTPRDAITALTDLMQTDQNSIFGPRGDGDATGLTGDRGDGSY